MAPCLAYFLATSFAIINVGCYRHKLIKQQNNVKKSMHNFYSHLMKVKYTYNNNKDESLLSL